MAGITVVTDYHILDNLKKAFSDPTPLLESIGRGAVEEIKRAINSATSPDGVPMVPNAPLTVAVKKGSHPLKDTGMLLHSITYSVEGKDAVIAGASNAVNSYAGIQQHGGVVRAKNRPYLLIPTNFQARQWLRGAGSAKAKRTFIQKKQVVIPARPFLPKGNIENCAGYMAMLKRCINKFLALDEGMK